MDYGKYKYETAQKAKESRRKSTNVSIKEMKYRPKIGGGDFDTKTRKVEKFLVRGSQGQGHDHVPGPRDGPPRARQARSSTGSPTVVVNTARVEVVPKLDGRNMIMVLAPDKRAQAAHAAAQKKEAEEHAATDGTGDAAGTANADRARTSRHSEPTARAERERSRASCATARRRRCPR